MKKIANLNSQLLFLLVLKPCVKLNKGILTLSNDPCPSPRNRYELVSRKSDRTETLSVLIVREREFITGLEIIFHRTFIFHISPLEGNGKTVDIDEKRISNKFCHITD